MHAQVYPAYADREYKQSQQRHKQITQPLRHAVSQAKKNQESIKRHCRHRMTAGIAERIHINKMLDSWTRSVDDLFQGYVWQGREYQHQACLKDKFPAAMAHYIKNWKQDCENDIREAVAEVRDKSEIIG